MSTPVLSFQDVWYAYPGQQTPALQGVNLEIPAGQRVALIGRNGSGKSTLLQHCNGLLKPARGAVLFKAQPLSYDRAGLRAIRQKVGFVFQDPDEQLFSASVAQDISFGPLNLGCNEEEARQRVQHAAARCEITHLLDRPTHALSHGEKACAALAGILAMQPEVLIADELTTSLDPWARYQIITILNDLVAEGVTVILSTHDMQLAQRWAQCVVILRAGQIETMQPPADIFSRPDYLSTLQLLPPDI